MVNIHLVLPCEVAFCEAEVMDGVEQVGLAYAVPAADANDPFGERKLLLHVVLELEDRYGINDKAGHKFIAAQNRGSI
jgi:hypothetical protein